MSVKEAFLQGKPVWGIFYILGMRLVEKIELEAELRKSYRCRIHVRRYDLKTNRLVSEQMYKSTYRKDKLDFEKYHLSLEDAVNAKISLLRRELEYLKNVKIPALEREIKFLKEGL